MSASKGKKIDGIVQPDLADVLQAVKDDVFKNLNCHQLGIIEEFNPDDQTATIRFALKHLDETLSDGTKIFSERPIVQKVPCVMLYGGSSYLTFPIAPGDECLVMYNDREIDSWFASGAADAGVVTLTSRMHDACDAIALVGIRSLQKSIGSYLTNGIRMAFADDVKIDMTAGQIKALADLFIHDGNVRITGNLEVVGDMTGDGGGALLINSDIIQTTGKTLSAGNGATGTFNIVNVIKGIVVSGS